ncbi:MAG: hypothetical protein ACQERJ_06525 [Bacillota bacterium]
MKKWVVILLIVALSSGLYLYYSNNWQHKLDQLAQFEEQMNQPLQIEEKVEVELSDSTNKEDDDIPIISPFKSELNLEDLQDDRAEKEEKSLPEEESQQNSKSENKRPSFKLLGILSTDTRTLVTMVAGNEIKRLTVGEEIKGFKLVEINKNNVVLKIDNKKFTFWLGSRPQGEEAVNQVQGGNQN